MTVSLSLTIVNIFGGFNGNELRLQIVGLNVKG